jgi:uncharacterized damage-inducible protein DinB
VITPQYIRIMARYNSEMNRRIYAGAARLSDAQRREDVGLFWQSLHGTLCHLLWGDRQWMSRLDGWPPNTIANPQSPTLIHDFAELHAERENADARIEDFANRIDEAWLAEDLTWYSGAAKQTMRREKAGLMVHFFNHQTHHRGQAHAALTMRGVDPGDTDLFLVVPGLEAEPRRVPPLTVPACHASDLRPGGFRVAQKPCVRISLITTLSDAAVKPWPMPNSTFSGSPL